MTITLTPDLEEALDREAQNQGLSPEDLALQTLRRNHLPASPAQETPPGETLYDAVQRILAILPPPQSGSGVTHYSENSGEKFTQILLEKQADERNRYAQWLQEQRLEDNMRSGCKSKGWRITYSRDSD